MELKVGPVTSTFIVKGVTSPVAFILASTLARVKPIKLGDLSLRSESAVSSTRHDVNENAKNSVNNL
jgi:hypothetical protein